MQKTTITIQNTTNETIIKFNSNVSLINAGSYEYANIDEAKKSPLAQQLFYLPFVKKVFITPNFIAIQRFDIVAWNEVQEEVREQIENFINQGNVVVNEENVFSKKEAIEVYAEVTPNPAVMKFGINKILTQTDVEFKNIEEASKLSPLAQAIFSFPFVKEVFISNNYISITKFNMVEWNEIFPEVRSFIREYLASGKEVFKNLPKKQNPTNNETTISSPKFEGIAGQINDILEEYIKPAVASDGGNIVFQSYDEANKTVNVILQGACSGCPSSTATLKNGIENLLKEMLPNEINNVVAVNG